MIIGGPLPDGRNQPPQIRFMIFIGDDNGNHRTALNLITNPENGFKSSGAGNFEMRIPMLS